MQPAPRPALAPELDRQLFGYWLGPREQDEIPARPVGRPTGAVLPELGVDLRTATEIRCLDLVPVQSYWLVLSELGRYTYQHTSGMLFGEQWMFAPVGDVVGPWPVTFTVDYMPALTLDEVEMRYGIAARHRARPDALAVQLRLWRRS